MDFATDLPLPVTLAVLALADGLSVGTLLIPVFLLLAPGRVRAARILLYLGTISGFYLAVGVLFMLGLVDLVDTGRQFVESTPGRVTMLVVGVALLATGIAIGVHDSARKKRIAAGGEPVRGSGRLVRWRDRLLADGAGRGAVIGVALAAGVGEVAMMLPYLMGMTMIAGTAMPAIGRVGMLAGYCLVMIVPALALLVLRIAAAQAVDRPLHRLAAWLERTGPENTAWILGLVGFLMARAAATQLGIGLPFMG